MGEGFVTRISCNIRPQDRPGELEKMDVMNPPAVSVVEPQSAPTRISVVLVEEAKIGGAHRMECPRVWDLRLLAVVAKPARVTVCGDSHLSPSVEGTLSSPDLAGKLFPVVPAGIPLPVGPVGPVGPCGTTSPSNLTSIGLVSPITDPVGPVGPYVAHGPVGLYGMLSPCDSDQLVADGPVGPYVARGPVGSYGMLSPRDSACFIQLVADGPVGPYVARGPVGSYGMLSPCDSDSDPDQPVADGPVDPYVTRGPVSSYGKLSPCNSDSVPDQPVAESLGGPVYVTRGPVGSYGMLSLCDSDFNQHVADGPVGPYVTCGPVGSYGTSFPCDYDTPGPVMQKRTLPQSRQGGGECIDMYGRWSGSNVAGTPTAVAVVDLRAGSTVTDVSSNGVDDCEYWDSDYQREIIDGVTVYYGGDLCDSEDWEDSDWEVPEDVARREYVADYNFDLLEDMHPMVFVPGGNPSRFDRRDEYKTYLFDGNDACVPDDDSVVDRECRTWREYCASIFLKGLAPFPSDAPVSPPRNGCRDQLCSHEDWTDTMPPEHHVGLRDIAHVPTLCRMRMRIGLIRRYQVTWKCLCWH